MPAPLSFAVADAGNIAATSSLVARPGLRPAPDRPSRGLQCACAAATPARWSSAGVARPQAACRPRSVLTRHLVDFVHRWRLVLCNTCLTQVLRCLFTPTRRLGCAKTAVVAPPSPQRGALTRPANITRGDYAHWPRGTLPDGRRPLSRVRPSARIIRVMYAVRGSQLRFAASAVRWRHCVPHLMFFPTLAGPRRRAAAGLKAVFRFRLERPGLPPFKSKTPCRPERSCACLPGSG